MDTRQFYMCPPAHYEIEYAINRWMDADEHVNRDRAFAQWNALRRLYVRLGVAVEVIAPAEDLPELTFPGDSVLLSNGCAVISNFRFGVRQPESEFMEHWARSRGFDVVNLPDHMHFEGNAEAMVWNELLLAGYGVRSDLCTYEYLRNRLRLDVVTLQLLDTSEFAKAGGGVKCLTLEHYSTRRCPS